MVFKLENRSMTSASATMEHASKGQMGQPAACMIENNAHLQTDIGAGLWRSSRAKKLLAAA
ncbi:hypothetical protein [Polaromonas sp. DSR2-3-2]|uniref:hypothetical protein n=1 Tax=unclassified Polaromonas TaxID=2638319 RepID=UPI003CE78E5E